MTSKLDFRIIVSAMVACSSPARATLVPIDCAKHPEHNLCSPGMLNGENELTYAGAAAKFDNSAKPANAGDGVKGWEGSPSDTQHQKFQLTSASFARNPRDRFAAKLGKSLIAPIAGPALVGAVAAKELYKVGGPVLGFFGFIFAAVPFGVFAGVFGLFTGGVDKDFWDGFWKATTFDD